LCPLGVGQLYTSIIRASWTPEKSEYSARAAPIPRDWTWEVEVT